MMNGCQESFFGDSFPIGDRISDEIFFLVGGRMCLQLAGTFEVIIDKT